VRRLPVDAPDALTPFTTRLGWSTLDDPTLTLQCAGGHDATGPPVVAELVSERFPDVVEVARAKLVGLLRGDEQFHACSQVDGVAVLVSYSAGVNLEAEHARHIRYRQVQGQLDPVGSA
jgi:hypothetical protein